MKKSVFPKALLILSSLNLLSCSSSNSSSLKGNIDDYYRIDFYSDYADMDYEKPESWDKSKAKHLGYGYIAKENSTKQDYVSLTYIDEENKDYNYRVSANESESGFKKYSFVGFKTTSGEKINEVTFTSSCDVFACFDISYKSYTVKIYNDEEPIFSENVEYGYSIKTSGNKLTVYDRDGVETETSFAFEKTDLPYYKSATFNNFEVTRKEGDGYVAYDSSDSSYLVNAPINITAKYNETFKDFVVSIPKTVSLTIDGTNHQIDTSIYFGTPDNNDDPDYNKYFVKYNDSFKPTVETSLINGINVGFVSFEEATYSEAEISGTKVDANHIKHNVTLIPKFAPASLKVNFHIGEEVISKEVAYGSVLAEVNPKEITGKECTLDWYKDANVLNKSNLDKSFGSSKFDLSAQVTTDLDLYSIYVDKALSLTGGDGNTYRFEFDKQIKGYVLIGIEGTPTSLDMNSISEFTDKIYNFKAIKKLNIQDINIENITFPDSLTKLYNDSLYTLGCKGGGTTLDLTNVANPLTIGSKAFRAMTSVTSIKLPFVSSIGTDAFKECDRLTNVSVKNSEDNSLFSGTGLDSSVRIDFGA